VPSLSRSLPSGPNLSAPVTSFSLFRGPGSPVPNRCSRTSPFLSLCRGPALSVPPSTRPPWTSACALAHVAGFLGHDARPHTQLSSYSPASAPRTPLASFHTPSPSMMLCPRRQPPPETRARVPGHPAYRRPLQASRAPPQGETTVLVPNFSYCALCSSNFAFAGARPRRSAVLARWPADLVRFSSPE
jgi:hypothetical protein